MIFLDDNADFLSPTMTAEVFSGAADTRLALCSAKEKFADHKNTCGCWEISESTKNGSFFSVARSRPVGQNGPYLYAIKRLREQWQHSQIGLAILQREAELGRLISHPHLVPVLDGNLSDGEPFLVQPWLTGNDLHFIASFGRTAQISETIWIGRQITEALCELERHGFCHCDLKPGNIMVSPTGHATLIDLGLARRTDEASLPIDHSMGGTPKYMAPELFRGSKTADIRADLFSLGLVMLEMLFGKDAPFSGDPNNRISANLWRANWQRLEYTQSVNRKSPLYLAEFESLLRSMVETNPENRPVSADQLKRQMLQLELALL